MVRWMRQILILAWILGSICSAQTVWNVDVDVTSESNSDKYLLTSTLRNELRKFTDVTIDSSKSHLEVSVVLLHIDISGGTYAAGVAAMASDPNMELGYLVSHWVSTDGEVQDLGKRIVATFDVNVLEKLRKTYKK